MATEPDVPHPRHRGEEPLRMGPLLAQAALGMVAVLGVVAVLGRFFGEPLMAAGRWFVDHFHGAGVFLGWYLPDTIPTPIVSDVFNAAAMAGGMGFWEVCAYATAGSLAGGSTGFLLGRTLGRSSRFERMLGARGEQARSLVARYGVRALLVAAITPIPYSAAGWASGALGMPYGRFLLASFARGVRIASHLWLIQIGLLSVGA